MSESRIQGSQHNLVPETETSVNEIDSRKGELSSEAQATEAAGLHADYDKVMSSGLSDYLAKQPPCDPNPTSYAGSGEFGKTVQGHFTAPSCSTGTCEVVAAFQPLRKATGT